MVAQVFADQLIALSRGNSVATLAAIYFATFVLTELLSNATAAALVFPIAIAAAQSQGIDPHDAAIVVMVGASASFATPIGYQTNTMVYAAADYRFTDFIKIGIPMNVIVGLATCFAVFWLF